jgi:endonuclease YncB( thermonuclease family)
MKRFFWGGLFAALAIQSQVAMASDFGTMPITRDQIEEVYDGDTFMITVKDVPEVFGKHIGVRISGLDSPERHSQCSDPVAKAGEEAKAMAARSALTGLLDSGQKIELRNLDRDKYFRILAEVWVGGQNVAPILISKGLAVGYHGEKKVGWCGPHLIAT